MEVVIWLFHTNFVITMHWVAFPNRTQLLGRKIGEQQCKADVMIVTADLCVFGYVNFELYKE